MVVHPLRDRNGSVVDVRLTILNVGRPTAVLTLEAEATVCAGQVEPLSISRPLQVTTLAGISSAVLAVKE
jgi:hypothetical protein